MFTDWCKLDIRLRNGQLGLVCYIVSIIASTVGDFSQRALAGITTWDCILESSWNVLCVARDTQPAPTWNIIWREFIKLDSSCCSVSNKTVCCHWNLRDLSWLLYGNAWSDWFAVIYHLCGLVAGRRTLPVQWTKEMGVVMLDITWTGTPDHLDKTDPL